MRLVVFSHKPCWPSAESPTGYASDGGFPIQMRALSELFAATTLVVPCARAASREGEIMLGGHDLSVVPLTMPSGRDLRRKVTLPSWFLRNAWPLLREVWRADAVHTPIPGDIGTIGMVLALILQKPLFVRYCGNWFVQRTTAERFWKWFMERFSGGRNVALATGGAAEPPSRQNKSIRWIFSTSLTDLELSAYSARRRDRRPQGTRLIIACRQEGGKGSDIVIRSLPLILSSFPKATLEIVGDGSALGGLKRLAESLKLMDRVRFHGKVDHERIMSLIQDSDVFCYPTASEGFPKVVIEALACGLPVVTTRVSVLPQLVSNGCGILIDEPTPEAVAQAVIECLRNPLVYEAMSARAGETVRQYSLERWRDAIGEALKSAWGPLKSDA